MCWVILAENRATLRLQRGEIKAAAAISHPIPKKT
jgi:hypothetical protein